MNVSTDTYYADGQGNTDHFVDLTEYEELRIYRDDNTAFRAFFINSAGTNVNQISSSSATWNAEEKYWSLNLSSIEKWDNKVALKTIKSSSYQVYDIVKNIVVYKTPAAGSAQYLIKGKGLQDAATTTLLADATVTSIDVTGMTNVTATTLTSANPNCLFIANSGKLSNANNVIVSGTCNKLELTDNYPFMAPSNFTATSASYTTTINETAKAGTLCLPFAASIPDGVKAYTLTCSTGATEAEATKLTGIIPANTPVLLNGSGSVTFEGSSAAVDADATNVSGAMTGVFARTQVPADRYVLQYDATDGLGFYKVESDNIYANPFRAYLTASTPSRGLSIVYANDETTGIADVRSSKEEVKGEYYNLKGQRIAQPTKGLYIKNGKKYIVK